VTARLTRLRRPLASLFAAAAAGLALLALRPSPPASAPVLAAAHDLPAGKTLASSDLRPVDLPPSAVPSGALHGSAVGRVLAGPMRKGEPLTDARVLGDALLQGYAPGTVATPVRITDPAAVRLLHPGDRIDVLSSPTDDRSAFPPTEQASTTHVSTRTAERPTSRLPKTARTHRADPQRTPSGTTAFRIRDAPTWADARVVVTGVPVVAVPPAEQDDGRQGALVVLATDRPQALALAAAGPLLSLTITGH